MGFDAYLRFRAIGASEQSKPRDNKLSSFRGRSSAQFQSQTAGLLSVTELPGWVDANPFILSGYRRESRSIWQSLASWTYLHNESCNIYSHLVPAVFLLVCSNALYQYLRERIPALTNFDWAIVCLQLLSGTACLLISTFYHTLRNHSHSVAHRWLQLDYVGIVALTVGNFISGLHFGFYCHPSLKYFYWSVVTMLGSASAFVLLISKFRGPDWRTFRLSVFICTGLFAFVPIGHALILWGPGHLWQIGVPYYLWEGLFLLCGCYFWERRIPERLFPGMFDIWGHSHTIWHAFVALSIGAHIFGLLDGLDYSYSRAPCRAL